MCQTPEQITVNEISVIFLCLHFLMESRHILLLSNILDFVPCNLQLQRAYIVNFKVMSRTEGVTTLHNNLYNTKTNPLHDRLKNFNLSSSYMKVKAI